MPGLFDDLAVGDTIITVAPAAQMYGHTNPATGERDIIDAPRTPRAIQARRMAEWKARQPRADDLKDFCPHECYLPIEACDEGCGTVECPGCDRRITPANAGGYRTFCETCVAAFPPFPDDGEGHLIAEGCRYPNFRWE